MTRDRYLEDSFVREFTAKVVSVNGKYVVLDDTGFYPASGGQPHDTGVMEANGNEYTVVYVGKFDGKVSHEVDKEGLTVGDTVHCRLDWDRRYRLMRMHTAAHVLMQTLYLDLGALGTGNELGVEQSRIDFSLEKYDPALLQKAIDDANETLARNLPVTVSFMTREEALKIPGITKLAKGLPDHLTEVRVVSIGDFDVQADGGTHVKSTKEVGRIVFVKAKNKGQGRKRVYFTLAHSATAPS